MVKMKFKYDIIRGIRILLFVGMLFSLSYISALALKSSFLYGAVIYLMVISASMLINMGIGMAYNLAQRAGKPLPGFFSSMQKHLTQEEFNNLSNDHDGRRDAIIREFLIIRMDIIVPSGIVFFLMMAYLLPSIATNTLNDLMLAILFSIFALSYLIYTCLSAYLYSVKVMANISTKQNVNIDDLINATLLAAT